jgi:serine/threonine protein kinase/dienelactone hydrolase
VNHPNIATIHEELQEAEGTSYLVLEYVEGETLRERIARDGLNVEEAISIALQIAEALSAAHGKGVIHRDLKPANIKITPEGRVKVLDFSVAKMLGGREGAPQGTIVTQPGQVIGTPGYMSPEQSLGKDTDYRTDIWSFGCVLYEMLTAKRPFPGRDTSEILEAMLRSEPSWESLPEEVESPLREIIRKCLVKNPGERYQSFAELYHDLSEYYAVLTGPATKELGLRSVLRLFGRPRLAIPATAVLLVLCTMGIWLVNKSTRIRWARTSLLPDATRLMEDAKFLAAFLTAQEAEKYIPDDSMLLRLWPEISKPFSVDTSPPGADVFFREYSEMDSDWKYLGRSPIEKIRFPKGLYRFKITKEGYETRECIAGQDPYSETRLLTIELWEKNNSPDGMVLISSETAQSVSFSKSQSEDIEAPGYWIDKYEVTNEKFKEFVDQGGYQNQDYWKHTFIRDGRQLTWEDAMVEFRDQTNRPGPSTWSGGTYPEGHERHPVSGISWYEAAAYAEFAGKSLPTVRHWGVAACRHMVGAIVPWSNMVGTGSAPVGSYLGIGLTGLYDMAGNVREWCWNADETDGSRRYILGGSWIDPTYMFTHDPSYSVWDRSPLNGVRCLVFRAGEEDISPMLFDPIKSRHRGDMSSVKPVSDNVFKIWVKDLYSYDRDSLNAETISIEDTSPYYRREEVEFNAAYGGERVTAFLFLPKSTEPPYQAVIFFPGWGAVRASKEDLDPSHTVWDFIIKSGRAFMYPLYKNTHDQRKQDISGPVKYRDWIIQLSKDVRRSIDYLEARNDIDSKSLAYFGYSWGTWMGTIVLAVEERFNTGILAMGGLQPGYTSEPSGQPPNFVPRIKIPILMVNGREDPLYPFESRQVPLYMLLGTPEEHRKHITYPGGHSLLGSSRVEMRKDILEWLDRYLGLVN